jgi:hypothetical protein
MRLINAIRVSSNVVSRVFRKRFGCRVEEVKGVGFRGKQRVLNWLRRLRLSEIQQLAMPVVLDTRLACFL